MERQDDEQMNETKSPRSISARWFALGGCLILMAAVAAVYAPVRNYDYVDFDDGIYVFANPHVLGGLTATNLAWAVTTLHGAYWHPATWISLMADTSLFGASPGAYHLVNVAFHVANACLLFWAFWLMTGCRRRALLAALIFALHPLRVESVAWITERKDVLSAFFLLGSLLAYIVYAQTSKRRWFLLCALALAASLTAKPMALAFPGLLLVLDCWPLGRWGKSTNRQRFGLLIEKALLMIPVLCVGGVVAYAQWRAGTIAPVADTSIASRLSLVALSFWRYIWQIFQPVNLTFFYEYRPAALWSLKSVFAWLGFALLALAAWRLRRQAPWFAAGLAWYAIALLPFSGLIRVGGVVFADRFTYLPHMGLCVAMVWALASIPRPAHGRRWFETPQGLAALGIVLLGLAVATRMQLGSWRDSDALFERALEVDPNSELALINVGARLAQKGKLQEALKHFEKAIELGTRDVTIYFNAGNAHYGLGNNARAEECFVAALNLDPMFVPAGINLGLLMAKQNRWDEAIYCLQTARRLEPQNQETARLLESVMRQARTAGYTPNDDER